MKSVSQAAAKPNPNECPKCGPTEVHPSRLRDWKDNLMAKLGRPPMRCHRCNHRFYGRAEKVQG